MGAAFVDVTTEDNTAEGRSRIGSTMAKWAGGLAIGGLISKGISDNLDIGEANAKLSAQLNLTKDVADHAGKLAGEIYRDNFGASIPEVNTAISTIGQSLVNLNTVSDTQLKQITEGVLGLSSTFGVELNSVVDATSKLISNKLAPDAESAMNLMTRAFQTGGNQAGDLLETISEYSPYFHSLGLDGSTALGLLSQGLKAGARDTDYIADAFKEFGIRAIDGSMAVSVAYEDLGFKAKDMMDKIAAGGPGAQEGLLQVMTALQNMQDPVKKNLAGVALFGSQWEDTVRQILPQLDLTEAGLTDVEGATDKMNDAAANSAKNGIESVKRQMEGWLQSVTSMDGPLGAISSWAVGFGGMALPLITQLATIGAAFFQMGLFAEGSALRVVGGWIAMAAASAANAVVMAASWLLAFWPIVLIVAAVAGLVALVIMNWDTIKQWTIDTWNMIWKWISDRVTDVVNVVKGAVNGVIAAWDWLAALPGKIWTWMTSVVVGAGQKLGELINWFKGLPGRILDSLGDLGSLLLNAGKRIIDGFLNGIKNAFNAVKNFVGGIGSWIADHKGPIEVDAVLLTPHGNKIMEGLAEGLEAGFTARVRPQIEGVAADLANTTLPVPAIGNAGALSGPIGSDGAALPAGGTGQAPVHIENLNVSFPGSLNAMSKTDLIVMANFLKELLRKIERGQVTV